MWTKQFVIVTNIILAPINKIIFLVTAGFPDSGCGRGQRKGDGR